LASDSNISIFFSRAAQWTSRQCGRPLTFALAVTVIVVWAITGPMFNYSDTWQLIINTGTTIVTFLMVFLIQASQNRDSAAVQLKLDELIRVTDAARNKLLTLEDLTEAELDRLKEGFARTAVRNEAGVGTVCEAPGDVRKSGAVIESAPEQVTALQGVAA
jgi:low affinity Fe/Cu permease